MDRPSIALAFPDTSPPLLPRFDFYKILISILIIPSLPLTLTELNLNA